MHIPLPFIESWEDFFLKAKAPPPDITAPLASGVLETVETIVGAKFHHPHILAQALVSTDAVGMSIISHSVDSHVCTWERHDLL